MKKSFKGILICILALCIITASGICLGKSTQQKISVYMNQQTIKVNGSTLTGDNITYAGNIYIRADKIAEAVGYDYKQDKNSNTVTMNLPSATSSNSSTEEKKTVTVYITKTGAKYHRAGCSYLRQSCIAISLDDAKAQGYTPCSRCNPPY